LSTALPIAFLAHVPLSEIQRLLVGVADHAVAVRPHLDFPAIFLARQHPHFIDILARRLHVLALDMDEDHIAMLGREMAAHARAAGIHDDRERLLNRLRLMETALDVEIAAVVVELFFCRP
jgi:hypothetical protein